MRNKSSSETFKSTVLPYQPNSCQNCWNRPKTQTDDEFAPRSHGIYTSVPVYLVELDGAVTLIGYRAQCLECNDVKWYNGFGCLYRPMGKGGNFKIERWLGIRRNGLDAEAFQRAVFEKHLQRYFYAEKLPKFDYRKPPAETLEEYALFE